MKSSTRSTQKGVGFIERPAEPPKEPGLPASRPTQGIVKDGGVRRPESRPVRCKDADTVGAKGQDVVGFVAFRVAMLHAG